MRDRFLIVVATIAASVFTACSDAAVDQVTAPPSTATPAEPVAAMWPTEAEYESLEASGAAIGIQIDLKPYFSADTQTFVVEAQVHFQWANDVSATVWASLVNRSGTVINSSEAGMAYQRFGMPVAKGDTTFVVRVSTGNIKCGLTGKSAYAGHAYTKAIDAKFLVFNLWEQQILKTHGDDVVLPDCPIANGYAPEINRLCRDYTSRGVRFYLVQVDPDTSPQQASQHAREFGYACPVVLDAQHALVRRAGATVVPEAAVFAPDGERKYLGRIDDQYADLGKRRAQATSRDLRDALDAVLADRPVPRPVTQPVGCSIPPLSSKDP